MPSFYKEVRVDNYTDVDIDVDVDEFLDACTEKEVEEVIGWLKDNDFPFDKNLDPTKMSGVESLYEAALDKLRGKWNRLSKEEEDFILKLGSKF